ncbi:hypothetical protein BFJ63_vAg18049 [Fusarium oxysporum f. sp. narcissi]|uniref:Uncharacterized protein n=1 Tax=Fusarium oxysporum f. sp. narcissi TaxID=451672 RepID=A0A4Q2V436_FUSOX|nr:hypothetical protein BFJ63_vAg18049 [Fusarium oxysporum f. sp. narcissi]
MSKYEVTVDIDKYWVKKYNDDKAQLCFSHGVGDNTAQSDAFNVIGGTEVVAENVIISWEDTFSIAGSAQKFDAGTKVESKTEPGKIKFKERVGLEDNFVLTPAQPDEKLKEGSFAFDNKIKASAVLYKQVSSGTANNTLQPAPFYISVNGPNAPGSSVLTPKAICRLFFANVFKTGTMVDSYTSEFVDVDLTGKTKATVAYNEEGHWKVVGVE